MSIGHSVKCRTAIFIIFAVLSVSACTNRRINDADYYILELDKYISQGNTKLALNDIAEEMRVIPVETNDSTLFRDMHLIDVVGDKVMAYESSLQQIGYVYSIDKYTGEVAILLNKQGQGPHDYSRIDGVRIENDTIMKLFDIGKHAFLSYDLAGNYKESIKSDSIVSYYQMQDGNFYVFYAPYFKTDFLSDVYDRQYRLLRHGIPNLYKDVDFDILIMNGLFPYDNQWFFWNAYTDTIYQVSTAIDKPYLVLQKGIYKMPIEILAKIRLRYAEMNKYIDNESFRLVSGYCFLDYLYDEHHYYDIWEISTSKLRYRNIVSNETRDYYGIPVKLNGIEIRVWPNLVKEDYLYCKIQSIDVLKIYPSAPEDTNPMILEVRIK
jgi:hypothetical protein